MEGVHEILGQVPPEIRHNGSARERAEEIWRVLGRHRNGQQTRLAGDLAERWERYRRRPRLPVDDPQTAAKRLARCLAGEMSLDVDLFFEFQAALPDPFRTALEVMTTTPKQAEGETAGLSEAVQANRQADNFNDGLITELLITGVGRYTIDELEVLDKRLDTERDTIDTLRRAIRAEIERRRSS